MRCPSCGAEVTDPLASNCPECSAPLTDPSEEGTTRLDVAPADDDTSTLVAMPAVIADEADEEPVFVAPIEAPAPAAMERLTDVRTKLEAGGWLDAAAASGLGFLVLLAVGAVLVVAAKLNFPQLGGGADLLSAFTAVVMAGLGCLGIPIVIDGLAVWGLPLGALLAVGTGMMWATQTSHKDHSFPTVISAVIQGARVGVPFGLLCWFFALVFRVRGQHPIASDAGIALIAGTFWGVLFGALGALRVMEKLRSALARISSGVRSREPSWFEGAAAGSVMVVVAAVIGAAASLMWVIVALAKGSPGKHFGAGDAFAYVVYMLAFLPNIVAAVVSMSFGAPVQVGAKIDVGGRVLGPIRDYSLATWGRGDPPAALWLLVLIPLVACLLGGLYARRRATDPKQMVPVILIASAVFATALTLIGAVGPIRMAGVLKGSGYAFVAPDAVMVFLLSFLASGVLGAVGWKLAESTTLLQDRLGGSA